MFCQACGAENSKDARFCNMCGAPIATTGAPGGPVPAEPTALGIGGEAETPAAPPPALDESDPTLKTPREAAPESTSMMSVSLEDLGVRSNAQAGLVFAGVVAALMALGGAFAYFGTQSDSPPPETGHAEASDPFVIGAPIPEGLAGPSPESPRPEGVGEPEEPAGADPSRLGQSASPRRPPSSRRPRQPRIEPAATATADDTPPPSTETPETPGVGDEAEEPPSADSAADSANREIPTDAPEERDIELEMYAGRVRFLVQRYYSARAQTCFDHATVNDPGLHGTVVVDMTIAASGEVSRSTVARNSTGDATLGQCLARQVGEWRLSPPPGGESIEMQMPFSR